MKKRRKKLFLKIFNNAAVKVKLIRTFLGSKKQQVKKLFA